MIIQRSSDWFQQRLGKATASRFADVMTIIKSGESAARKNYRAQLVAERLTSKVMDSYQSAEMLWGVDNEPLARLHYKLRSKNEVEETGFIEHAKIPAGASPDGLIGTDGGLEIKCPNTATHIETLHSQKIPNQYYPQVQGCLWITGRKWWDFVSFDPRLSENACIIILRINRDDTYIEALEAEVKRFLEEVDREIEFIHNYGKETKKGASRNTTSINK